MLSASFLLFIKVSGDWVLWFRLVFRYEQTFVYNLLVHLKCAEVDPEYVPTHGHGAVPPELPPLRKSKSRRRWCSCTTTLHYTLSVFFLSIYSYTSYLSYMQCSLVIHISPTFFCISQFSIYIRLTGSRCIFFLSTGRVRTAWFRVE